MIISGGENLYPVQIEDFLASHPKIHDVAVIGLPDKRLGEIAAAIIQIKQGMTCTESEIKQFCMDLPRYKRPRKIIFTDIPAIPPEKSKSPSSGRNTAVCAWWRPRTRADRPSYHLFQRRGRYSSAPPFAFPFEIWSLSSLMYFFEVFCIFLSN